MSNAFSACEICGANEWTIVRTGSVRDGAFGRVTAPDAQVGRCGGCAAERLSEAHCHDDSIYASTEYRKLLEQGVDAESFFAEHDRLQLQNLDIVLPQGVRGKRVVDVGCAAGSFLDHIQGLAAETVGVEPCTAYHQSLQARGHRVHASLDEAADERPASADLVVCFSVIEHVRNPREVLAGIRRVLAPGGKALISTPNRRDVLMELLPSEYPAFFYRSVHRWYFDAHSFANCARAADLQVDATRCVHRFGLANALLWLRDRKPGGRAALPSLGEMMDSTWQSYLEDRQLGDYLFFWLSRA